MAARSGACGVGSAALCVQPEPSSADAPRPCLIADRAQDGDALRAWRAPRGLEAVIPARKGRTNPQPRPERYPARKAVARGLGGLKGGGA